MASCELVLPPLHPGQQRIVRERRRFNCLACGRRWGKSTLCLSLLLDDPGWDALGSGYPVAWFAGTSKIFDEVWRLALRTLPPEVIRRTDTQKHRIELVTGGVIDFWTLDGGDRGGAGRGRKYRRAVIDEAAMVPGMLDIWSRAIRPTLLDLEGDAYFASTPRGILNDFHTLYQRGMPGPDHDANWRSWQVSTEDNPVLPRAEIAAMRKEYAGRPLDMRQEIDAEFVEDQGQVFDLAWLNEMAMPKGWKPAHVYQAWDLAGTKQDLEDRGCESVGVALCKDWMGRWWLIDLVRGKWNPGELIERILSFAWKHRAQRVWGEDPVAMYLHDFLTQRMRQSGKHVPFERVSVQGRGDKVARAQAAVVPVMANGSFYCDPAAPWYGELRRDLAAFPSAGKDLVDALSLAFAEAMACAVESPAPRVETSPHDPRIITWDDLVRSGEAEPPRPNPWRR